MADPVLDAAPDGVITIDASGLIVEFNSAAGRMFGFQQLEITRSTVGTHLEHVYSKLGVSDRAAAAATAIRLGLIG